MVGDSNSVEIRITGALDSSVAGSTAAASAELNTLAAATANVGKTTAVNYQQIIDSSVGVERAAVSAKDSLLGTAMAAAEISSNRQAAATLVEIGEAGNVAAHGLGNTRAVSEALVVTHEALQNRFTRIPGSLMIMTQALTGGSSAMLLMGAATLAAVGAFGYLEYESLAAKRELDHLTEGFELTGRGAQATTGEIAYNVGFLEKLPGATKAATDKFLEFVAAHANVSLVLANEVGQLMPAFIKTYGKDAPEAAGKLTETLSNLTIEGFQKLDREMLNLPPVQYETIENLIRTGHEAEATSAILQALSKNSGVYIKSLGDQVYDQLEKIKKLKATMTDPELRGIGDTADIKRLRDLENGLTQLRSQEAAKGKQEADNRYKSEIDGAQKVVVSLDRIGTAKKEIARLDQDAAEAAKRGDTQGQSTFLAAKADEEKKLARIVEEENKRDTEGARKAAREKATLIADFVRQTEEEMKKATQEYNANQRDDVQTTLEISKMRLAARRQELDADFSMHKISARQKYEILADLATQEAQLDERTLAAELNSGTLSTEQKHHVANEILLIDQKLKNDLAALNRQETADVQAEDRKRTQSYRSMVQEITGVERSLVQDIFSGQKTLSQMLFQISSNLVEREIENDLEYYTQKKLYSSLGLAVDETAARGGLLVHVLSNSQKAAAVTASQAAQTAATATGTATRTALSASESTSFLGRIGMQIAEWLGLETAKTVDTSVGVAARTAAAATETAAAITAAKAMALAEIPAYTGIAAMGAASAVAPIPFVGPALAAAAFAQMEGLGAAALGMASFDVGTNYVPGNMVALIHEGERIVPKADNRELMDAVAGGGNSGGGGGDTYNIHALDAKSFARWAASNPSGFAAGARSARQRLKTF